MTRASGFVSLVALAFVSVTMSGQDRTSHPPSLAAGDWPHYTADIKGTKVLAARGNQRGELQSARGRVAVQDRRPRAAPRIQARGHAARDRRRGVHHGRDAAIGRRARREDGRAAVGAQPARGAARRYRAAPALGPRTRGTGRTAKGTTACCTSPPDIASSPSTHTPARWSIRLARTASSI